MTGLLPSPAYWGTEWGDAWDDPDPPAWSGWNPDRVPPPLPPRCGRVLLLDGRYERAGLPGDPGDPPRCGRPAGHPPVPGKPWKSGCRSAAAWARQLRADRDRQRHARQADREDA